jgi:hypothetical protein
MTEIIDVDVNGKTIFFEVDSTEEYGTERTSSKKKLTGEVANMFEQAKSTIMTIAESMVSTVRAIDKTITPDEFNLEFAIRFTAEGHVVIAKASAESSLKVGLKYINNKER